MHLFFRNKRLSPSPPFIRPITNREHEMERGMGSAAAYARFESIALQGSVMHMPFREQIEATMQFQKEWSDWLDAPYEPGKVFCPSYGRGAVID